MQQANLLGFAIATPNLLILPKQMRSLVFLWYYFIMGKCAHMYAVILIIHSRIANLKMRSLKASAVAPP